MDFETCYKKRSKQASNEIISKLNEHFDTSSEVKSNSNVNDIVLSSFNDLDEDVLKIYRNSNPKIQENTDDLSISQNTIVT